MEQIDKFAGHPAYAGQLFIDEPSVSYFDTLKEYITEYKKRHSDKLCYVNMLPYYALAGTGSSRYEDYVDTWIDKTSPAFYSYDSYPLIDYDPTQEGYRAEMEDFYYNLDLLRAKTLENGIPLWTFVATLGYQHASEPNRRDRRGRNCAGGDFPTLRSARRGCNISVIGRRRRILTGKRW